MRPIAGGRKTRLIYAGAVAMVLALPATAVALSAAPISSQTTAATAGQPSAPGATNVKHATARTAARRGCAKLFTVKMGERAAKRIYSGTRKVPKHALKLLGYIERCQRNPAMRGFVRAYDHRRARRHRARVAAVAAARARAARRAGGWRWPWSCIAKYESGGNPAENTGNGFYGGLQFTMSTWRAYGGSGNPADASIAEQEAVAQRVLAAQGWGAWPNTSRMCGL